MSLLEQLKSEAVKRGLLEPEAVLDLASVFALVRDMPYRRASDRQPETGREPLPFPWLRQLRETGWARFEEQGFPTVGKETLELQRSGASAFLRSFGVLGTAVKESPEFAASRRRTASSKWVVDNGTAW